MSSTEVFWTYWLPHYADIVRIGLFTVWLLFSPFTLLLLLWSRYAAASRRWQTVLNRLLATSGLLWMISTAIEFVYAWYSQTEFVQYAFINSYTGLYWWTAWRVIFLVLVAQLFWLRRWRSNWMLTALLLFNWLGSSFMLCWQLAHNEYLPSSWPLIHWLTYLFP